MRNLIIHLLFTSLASFSTGVCASCNDDFVTSAPPSYGLRITERTTQHAPGDTDRVAAINLAYVDYPGGARPLHGLHKPLEILDAAAADDFRITLVNARGAHIGLDQIPTATVRRLVDVLRGRWDFTLSDCAAFACYLVGAPVRPRDYATNEILERARVTEAELRPGDLVGIENDDELKLHLAIFLGPQAGGIYLSQFGMRSPLVVTSLDQMIKFDRAPHLYRYGVGP